MSQGLYQDLSIGLHINRWNDEQGSPNSQGTLTAKAKRDFQS